MDGNESGSAIATVVPRCGAERTAMVPIFGVKIEEILPGQPERLPPPRPAQGTPLVPMSAKSIASDTLWFY